MGTAGWWRGRVSWWNRAARVSSTSVLQQLLPDGDELVGPVTRTRVVEPRGYYYPALAAWVRRHGMPLRVVVGVAEERLEISDWDGLGDDGAACGCLCETCREVDLTIARPRRVTRPSGCGPECSVHWPGYRAELEFTRATDEARRARLVRRAQVAERDRQTA